MNFIAKTVQRFDVFQQKHSWVGFPYAVIKKFGDDNGSYQAALITYYSFLSLFPLMLVAVMVLQLLFHNQHLQASILHNITSYLPVVGTQLQQNVHTSKTGLGLIVAIIVTLYGARGGADALRYALDNMWQIPQHSRAGFPKALLRSFGVIGVAALGLVLAVAISSFSSLLGHAVWIKVLFNILGVFGLTAVMTFGFRVATSRGIAYKDMIVGSFIGAVIIQVLLTFGSILVKEQLRGFNSLYGTFAVVLGLLFWIYLLAEVLVYSIEIDTVRALGLWPRSITPEHKTAADRQANELYVQSAIRHVPESKKQRS
jgi:membrane protein